jgi:hypothetical protein
MKKATKYLIIDTFNGPGYSDSNASVVLTDDIHKLASDMAKECAGEDADTVKFNDADGKLAYVYDTFFDNEDNGAIHFIEYPENLLGVVIMPNVNDYEVLETKEELQDTIDWITEHSEDYDPDPEEEMGIYGTVHHGIGNDGADMLVWSREMVESTHYKKGILIF